MVNFGGGEIPSIKWKNVENGIFHPKIRSLIGKISEVPLPQNGIFWKTDVSSFKHFWGSPLKKKKTVLWIRHWILLVQN